MYDGLPELSYSYHPTNKGQVVAIKRGESGFYGPIETNLTPKELNAVRGISDEQSAAMLVGSMFGWDVPGADPKHYEKDQPKE